MERRLEGRQGRGEGLVRLRVSGPPHLLSVFQAQTREGRGCGDVRVATGKTRSVALTRVPGTSAAQSSGRCLGSRVPSLPAPGARAQVSLGEAKRTAFFENGLQDMAYAVIKRVAGA